jgi:membrane protease YdiL (CAAX protease family)
MEPLPSWKTFLFELLLFSILIVVYFAFVLHYLGGWFKEIYDHNRNVYAVAALAIMIGQTVGLELVCGGLIWLLRSRKKSKKK